MTLVGIQNYSFCTKSYNKINTIVSKGQIKERMGDLVHSEFYIIVN